jgi:Dolichyl-phosphate-mannose-protein mannosyltransferase
MTSVVTRRGLLAVVVGGATAGIVLRVVVYRSSLGVLDGDEAVWGLMARHVVDGELSAFFWGQGYGGTQEVLATAPLFALFGSSTVVMRLVPVALTAVAALLVWRIGRRTIGEPGASAAAVLFWVWPPYLVWKSERAHGFYGSGLVLVALVLLLVLRLAERRSRLDMALLGLVLGLGWWQTPQIVPIALPAVVWLTWRRPGVWRDAWLAAAAAFVGALPWLVSNVAHDWWSFDISSGQTPYPTRLRGFFSSTFPMALGLRMPFTSEWLLGTALSGLVYGALVVLFLLGWRRARKAATGLLYAVVVVFPFAYALSPSTWLVDEPRYVVVLLPVVVLLVGQALTTVPRAAVAVTVGVALSTLVLWKLTTSPEFVQRADGLFVPRNFAPLIAELERNGPRRLFAGYWIAYRTDFESRERITAAEATLKTIARRREGRLAPRVPRKSDENRHVEYDTIVRSDPNAGFVFLGDTPDVLAESLRTRVGYEIEYPRVRSLLERAGYQRTVVDGFAIYRRG